MCLKLFTLKQIRYLQFIFTALDHTRRVSNSWLPSTNDFTSRVKQWLWNNEQLDTIVKFKPCYRINPTSIFSHRIISTHLKHSNLSGSTQCKATLKRLPINLGLQKFQSAQKKSFFTENNFFQNQIQSRLFRQNWDHLKQIKNISGIFFRVLSVDFAWISESSSFFVLPRWRSQVKRVSHYRASPCYFLRREVNLN